MADASSLILLAKAGVLETFAARNRTVLPKRVYDEVVRGKEKGRLDSLLVEKLVQQGNLVVAEPAKATRSHIERTFGLRGGEADVTALALERKSAILTDDKKCMQAAKVLNIDFTTSLGVVVGLYKHGALARRGAEEALAALETYGWYHPDMVREYRRALG